MPRRIRIPTLIIAVLLALPGVTGCSSAVQADNPLAISKEAYRPTFDATVEVLREQGFRIARNDYRFGVISTYPKEAPTALEPWVGDHTTSRQAWRGTLNSERRIVEVRFLPADGAIAESEGPDDYAVAVQVQVQRLREPTRYLTHSAGGFISAEYADVPMHLRDRGVEAESWETIGNDSYLEQRLIAAITAQAAAAAAQEE